MTSDALAVVKCLFQTIWSLFTCFHIPGTHMTPAAWLMFFLFFGLVFRFLSRITGIGLGASSSFTHNLKSVSSHMSKGDSKK